VSAQVFDDEAMASAKALERWRGQRFGMFIHWGPVSQTGYEISWSRDWYGHEAYDSLYETFNPTLFDADEWAGLANAAGMKYMVITSKHHDGFCLFDSAYTDYDMMSTPYGQDICAMLAAACPGHDVDFCTYHSIPDWKKPDQPLAPYVTYLHNQVNEIIDKYSPAIMWFDNWEGAVTGWDTAHAWDLYDLCRDGKDQMLVNDRVYAAYLPNLPHYAGDYKTPEQNVGSFNNSFPWESCITIGTQWAWKPNDTVKSLKECLQTLVSCVGGDGNLLLNIGPKGDGSIEPLQVQRLTEMGNWLKRDDNSRAVYKTRGGPAQPQTWGRTTHRANMVYAHVWGHNWLGSHGTAAQSSTYGSGYEAYRSVDSDMTTFGHNASGDATPTWQILMDGNYALTRVELLNRMGYEDRATSYVVQFMNFTGNVNTQFGLGTGGTVLYTTETLNPSGGPQSMFTIDLVARTGGPLTCNFIRVVKTNGGWLHMAEVQAYATNQPGAGQQVTAPQMGSHLVQSAYLLRNPAISVPFTQNGANVTLNLNSVPGDPIDTVVAMSVSPDQPAEAETAVTGTVTGTYANTRVSDDVRQQICEVSNGAISELEHRWTINVLKHQKATFFVEAYRSANAEGDDFVFSYSLDGNSWNEMVTVTKTSDDDSLQYFVLPNSVMGTVHIRVKDTDRSNGNTGLDSVYVDYMFIRSEWTADLDSDGSVDLVDYAVFAGQWLASDYECGDFNDDDAVDLMDLKMLTDEWLR
jgi:alpha-L-fucosidase